MKCNTGTTQNAEFRENGYVHEYIYCRLCLISCDDFSREARLLSIILRAWSVPKTQQHGVHWKLVSFFYIPPWHCKFAQWKLSFNCHKKAFHKKHPVMGKITEAYGSFWKWVICFSIHPVQRKWFRSYK